VHFAFLVEHADYVVLSLVERYGALHHLAIGAYHIVIRSRRITNLSAGAALLRERPELEPLRQSALLELRLNLIDLALTAHVEVGVVIPSPLAHTVESYAVSRVSSEFALYKRQEVFEVRVTLLVKVYSNAHKEFVRPFFQEPEIVENRFEGSASIPRVSVSIVVLGHSIHGDL